MSGHESAPRSPAAVSPPHMFGILDRSPSPRARVSTPSRLPSITHHQPLEFDDMGGPSRVTPKAAVFGFSPPKVGGTLPPPGLGTSPVAASILLTKAGAARPILSPQLVSSPTADSHFPFFPDPSAGSPRPSAVLPSSPRGPAGEFPPRSRRNSAAIVSISLSSRSRSRTPRGSASVLPGARSGSGTPSKAPTPRAEVPPSLLTTGSGGAEAWAPGVEDMDEWNVSGGVLLDNDDADERAESMSFDDEEYPNGRSWTQESEASHAADVLTPGMIFGEGLQFEGDVIEAAVGRVQVGDSTIEHGLPLRRDGSSMGAPRAAAGHTPRVKKTYEVIRQLGSGSYAVVYLVRERGGRKREYALKCLSKHDLEEEQLETQLFEATIHLSLPIHKNLVTLHDTLQTRNWLFLLLELCPGEDLFYWLERSRDASPPTTTTKLPNNIRGAMDITSSSLLSSSSIPFSSSQLFSNFPSSFTNSPSTFSGNGFGSGSFNASPASLLFAHHNGSSHLQSSVNSHAATPPTPSLLSAFSANTLLTQRRLRLIASMFSQMCDAVAVCHDAGVSHRDIKPENFICCDSVELEAEVDNRTLSADGGPSPDFGPQAKRKVVVKLTDFGLATTEEESGDVECGSKPYMSYECRNNLGPTYRPAPADVWSLGIVLINMLFHRNPWKDPTEGDPNFDTFLVNPTLFFTSKFTGIGKEVATYIAEHVLCVEVEDRVSARELGQWIKSLPEMIAGRRALHALKMARLDTRAKQTAADKGLFVKSPVAQANNLVPKSALASALSSAAPVPIPNAETPKMPASEQVPSLSSLPPPSELAQAIGGLSQPAPTPDLDRDEIRSATTIDDHPTPTDMSTLVSPEPTESGENDDSEHRGDSDERDADADKRHESDERSLSTHKRRKRGVRKGKAAQAALAAQASGQSQDERDAFLSELVAASEELARDLSKKTGGFMQEEFPPLGTSPAQAAAARKSKWKDFLAMSKGNPQLEALARRVAERDVGGWSAPAKLQQGVNPQLSRVVYNKQTATSSGFSSQLSSVATASSSQTSSSNGGPEDDDWRRRPARINEDPEREARAEKASTRPSGSRRATEDSSSRSRQAALAAAAIAGGMEGPMGSFGKPSQLGGRPAGIPAQLGARPANIPARPGRSSHAHGKLSSHRDLSDERWTPPTSSVPVSIGVTVTKDAKPILREVPSHNTSKLNSPASKTPTMSNPVPIPSPTSPLEHPSLNGPGKSTLPQASSVASLDTITASSPITAHHPNESPNKPKLKGQIQSLAKMLGGLKTGKGKD